MVQRSCHLLTWARLGEELHCARATLKISAGHPSPEFRGILEVGNISQAIGAYQWY